MPTQDEILRQLVDEAYATPSEDISAQILRNAGLDPGELRKTITTGTGLVAFDLQAPAKNLYPVNTPIRNRIPRVGGGTGTATNWRQVNAIIGSGYDNTGWMPEGQRAGQMSYNTSTRSASFATLGEEDAVTFEAISAGRDFEDVRARMTMRLLQKTFMKEEMGILCGNASMQLGTPTTPTTSASGSGGTLPAVSTYSVIVVGLTNEGFQNSSMVGGVATQKTVTGADGKTYVLNGGCSNKSAAAAAQNVTSGQTLFMSTPVITGAVAYAWYVGATAGTEILQAITTINSYSISTPLLTGTQAATAVTGDFSTNSTAFDGLMTTAFKAGNNAYVQAMATGTAGVGTALTASGRGSINEVDQMLLTMWNNFQVTPSVLWVNAQELRNITTKVLSAGAGPLLSYHQRPNDGEYELTAGGTIRYYYNPFAQDGGDKIPIRIHPKVPPGTIIGWAENLPMQYQSNEVPNVAEVKERTSFYQIDWPLTTRQRQSGVYVEEVLAVYAPFACAILTNITNG
jgi:hypothetical protein